MADIKKKFFLLLIVTFGAVIPSGVLAQEDNEEPAAEGEEGEEGGPAPAIYLPVKPAFVVNYGGAGRLKYLKTEISIRLAHSEAANSVRHHLPFIRNNLVMLFAGQSDETLNSQEGRELMRQNALAEIQKVVMDEDGLEGVLDVYFNTFIIQN